MRKRLAVVLSILLTIAADPLRHRVRTSLAPYAQRQFTLCLEADITADFLERSGVAFWSNRQVRPREERVRRAELSRAISGQGCNFREQKSRDVQMRSLSDL